MSAVLLSVHLVLAIILIGPLTTAASLFPRYAREAVAAGEDHAGPFSVLKALHRISTGYAVAGIAVPVFGIATASSMGVLGDYWIWLSMAITLAAAVLFAYSVVPAQRRIMELLGTPGGIGSVTPLLPRLGMVTGIFGLLWAIVVVLMIVRPGSSTGV
ncbi:hypothetical protein KIH74_19950 [Kineosporia sp. J2-2]|uniref:Integral membrane protein DUF2269 n=1 Tax=Kineosporia corallincola TaxID=2835133 RepID=A0ABS5TLI4_9ACTN|nr:hypothetical protein [Kineosporia corallincola]MBT0771224.1 hypothetical protein [Kineosporia corallincola]